MSVYQCRTCGVEGEKNFYKTAKYQCKSCWNKRTYQDGVEKINKLKLEYGGKCKKCGYNKYLGALEFHHIDPNIKEFHLGQKRGLREDTLRKELDKCELLCSNCHKEVHAEI
jgi:hypothetical protein